MSLEYVEPRTVRLDLPSGGWLEVKQRLNAGESMDLFERAGAGVTDLAKLSPAKVGLALVLAYLVDWSAVDHAGAPIRIRGITPEALEARLRLLTFESFTEIMTTITAHDATTRQEKKQPVGASAL